MSSFNTENFTFVDFKEMKEPMSLEVWECRNLPEIRRWMTDPSPISLTSHNAFMDKLAISVKYLYFSVLMGGGICWFDKSSF